MSLLRTTKKPSSAKNRKNIRFPGDPAEVVYVDTARAASPSKFSYNYIGILSEESARGCGVVMVLDEHLVKGDLCRVRIGNGPIMKAEVRWCTELDARVMRIGLMYIEE